MKQFQTGFVIDTYAVHRFPLVGKGWTVSLSRFVPTHLEPLAKGRNTDHALLVRDRVVIEAKTARTAHRAHDLIWAADSCLGKNMFGPDLWEVDEFLVDPDAKPEDLNPFRPTERMIQHASLPLACEIAAKASFRLRHTYALMKLFVSMSTCSAHFVDLHPRWGTFTFQKSPRPLDHIRFAQCIVLCHDALEELGLQIKSNHQNPSRLSDGSWNPVVRNDLEGRLRRAQIRLDERLYWQVRGPVTKLESTRPAQIYHNAAPGPWSNIHVRDIEVDIVDAIAHLSWLRSAVCSHSISVEKARSLTVYDVDNAQRLVRTLILQKLGFWDRLSEPKHKLPDDYFDPPNLRETDEASLTIPADHPPDPAGD